jgi:hypothetical protein
MSRKLLLLTAGVVALVGAGAAAGRIGARAPSVLTYPSAQTIPAEGRLPGGAGHSISLNEPVGGDDAAVVVVSNATLVAMSVDARQLAPIGVQMRFRHFVRFGAQLVPDALLPWNGSPRRTEQQNQPLSIEVSIPYGTKPGTYRGSVTVTADSSQVVLPLAITVYGVQLPQPGDVKGSLLTVFGVGPQAYVNRVIELYHYTSARQIRAANDSLFAFLAAYRLSPDSWGYGIPQTPAGYARSRAWWKDSAGNMIRQLRAGRFPNLWIPVSNNRAPARDYVAGLSPYAPESWCGYLGRVRRFWMQQGWLANGEVPYVYAYDEPGGTHTSLLARQATVVHRCFPGAQLLTTATPDASTRRLWDGKGADDVDIWAPVDWRYYGRFTNPEQQPYGSREHMYLHAIDTARALGKRIFAFTYHGAPGFPSFRATEPLADPRTFVLWTALEGIDGILYGEGLTTYGSPGNPLAGDVQDGGDSLLIYPGNGTPIASARIEQIRAGIEDWEIFAAVRARFGAAKVREILGAYGLFSADRNGVKLACTVGCDLKGVPPQAWPRWSHDWSTAGRIEAARRAALKLASGS